jgi:MFS family permease
MGPARYNVAYVWSISLVAALGGLMFGYDWIVVGGAEPFYERFFQLATPSQQGWAMGSALVGCLLGAVVAGSLSDKFGRKRLLILAAIVFAVSSVGTGLAGALLAFSLWRIAGGVAIGLASNLSPMYIAELSPAAVRGRLVSVNQLTIVLGVLLAQSVNYAIAQHGMRLDREAVAADQARHGAVLDAREVAQELEWQMPRESRAATSERFVQRAQRAKEELDLKAVRQIVAEMNRQRGKEDKNIELDPLAIEMAGRKLVSWNVTAGWSWMFTVTAVPAMVFFTLMFVVPESPRWLAKNGKPDRARAVLARVGDALYADRELAHIEETLKGEIQRVNFRDLLEPRMRKILLLGALLAFLQQWCGINVIQYYATDIFRDAGYNVAAALQNIVILGAVNVIATVAAMYSVDRIGRRTLMWLGFASLTLMHALIGTSYLAHVTGQPILVLTLAALAFYAYTLAPVTWVVLSEIFPNRIRGAAMSVSVFSLWTGCFTLTFSFPHLKDWLGPAWVFWIYGLICLVGAVFVLLRLPETKGRTLEQIEHELF